MSAGAIEAPSTPVVQEYLSDVSSGSASVPTSGAGIGESHSPKVVAVNSYFSLRFHVLSLIKASYLTAMKSVNVLPGGAGIVSHVDGLPSGVQVSGAGVPSYLDAVGSASPTTAASGPSSNVASDPSTKIDTQISHEGSQTTITITAVTTVVLDGAA